MKKHLLSFFASMSIPALVQALPILEDFKKGVELSQIYDRPLVLVFTGSNWCEKSQKILKEILPSKEIGERLGNQFIFVKIDFPDQDVHREEVREEHARLKEKYFVSNFPAFILLDREGEEVTRFGYQSESSEGIEVALSKAYEKFQQVQYEYSKAVLTSQNAEVWENLYQKAGAEGTKTLREKILEKGVEVDQGIFFPLEKYAALVLQGRGKTEEAVLLKETIIKRDPNNERKALLRLALLDFQSSEGEEPEEAVAPIDSYIERFGSQDKDNLWRLHLLISDYFQRHGKNEAQHAVEK